MTIEELIFIKRIEKIYFNKFGKKLHIDLNAMNGLIKPSSTKRTLPIKDKDFKFLLKKHDIDLKSFKKNKLTHNTKNVVDFLVEFTFIINSTPSLSFAKCAKLINRNRTVFYHYNDLKYNRIVKASFYKK